VPPSKQKIDSKIVRATKATCLEVSDDPSTAFHLKETDLQTQVASITQSSIPTFAMLYRAASLINTKMKDITHPAIYTAARRGPRSRSGSAESMAR